MDAITTTNLGKTFSAKRGRPVQALNDLNLAVSPGEIFGFLGPNGAGKSTTIKILIDLIRPTTGQALLFGIPATSYQARQQVGYLPENPSFFDTLTGMEYLHFTGRSFGMTTQQRDSKAETILHRLSLWEARLRPIRTYSKGMVQRLGLAQALLHDPQLYILDEPMSGLDPLGRALIKEIMLELKAAGKGIFFSTHITSDVEAVCDRVGIIQEGTLRCIERIETIMAAGVTGYQIRYKDLGTKEDTERYVPKPELHRFLAESSTTLEITGMEPRRRSLEEFFLEIIKKGNA